MRKPFVAGNWKMNLNKSDAVRLATELAGKAAEFPGVELAVFPAFVHIDAVSTALGTAAIGVGAQDAYFEKNGAFTGEVSLAMLADLAVRYVLIGHSERRHVIGETDALLNKKLHAVIAAGMTAVLCIGETLEQRKGDRTMEVCRHQLLHGLADVKKDKAAEIVIAYEPVWAIGTGLNATKEQAQETHAAIRKYLAHHYDEDTAQKIRIQYGGSVKASNAAELLSQPDVDGALVGGASLKAEEFLGIITAASKKTA